MRDAILNFPKQFLYEPQIVNGPLPVELDHYVVLGMGGSALAAGLLQAAHRDRSIVVHRDYALPHIPAHARRRTLIIASSYSGNTEEVAHGFEIALAAGLPVVAIATGGRLLARARAARAPYIQLPSVPIQPRMALGYSMRALFAAMDDCAALDATRALAQSLQPHLLESVGKKLADELRGSVPVVYASTRYAPLGYVWKIKFNETGKIPAFTNVLPELNHNEMTGFDVSSSTAALAKQFRFLFLRGGDDDSRVARRMDVLEGLYRDRGLPVTTVALRGDNIYERLFSSALFADWAAYHLALHYGSDPTNVPMVEEFKRLIS